MFSASAILGAAGAAALLPFGLPGPASVEPVRTAPASAVARREFVSQETLVLQPGRHRISDLVYRGARFLGRNYLLQCEAAVADRTVHLQTRMDLDVRACEEVLSQILFTHDLVMTPVDPRRGLYEWVHLCGLRSHMILERPFAMPPTEVQRRRFWKVRVSTTRLVQSGAAQHLVHELLRFFPVALDPMRALAVAAVGDAVVMSGFADQVAAALDLLAAFDRAPLEPRQSALHRRIEELERRLRAMEEGRRPSGGAVEDAGAEPQPDSKVLPRRATGGTKPRRAIGA